MWLFLTVISSDEPRTEILKKEYAEKNLSVFQLEEFKISEEEPTYFDPNAIPIPALMLQTRYLTIKSFIDGEYLLRFSNMEVQDSMQKHILSILLKLDIAKISTFSTHLISTKLF